MVLEVKDYLGIRQVSIIFFFHSRDLRVEKSTFHQHVDQTVVLIFSSIDQVVQILLRKKQTHTVCLPKFCDK